MPRPKKRESRTSLLGRWWSEKDSDRAAALVEGSVKQCWDEDTQRRTQIERNLQRYGVRLSGLHLDYSASNGARGQDDLRINLVKAVTETISAKVGSNRPRPRVLTTAGSHSMKSRCKQLQRFLDGCYSASEVYEISPQVFRDAMLTGTGIIGFDADLACREIKASRVFPLELMTPAVDSVDARPREMFRCRFFDKDDLIDLYPDQAEAIENGPTYGPDNESGPTQSATATRDPRVVRVSYAWRLAARNAKGELVPGRFILACNNVALEDEPWEHDFFPFSFFYWSKPERGFWGMSAVAEIRPLENECNRLLQQAQAAMRVASGPIVLIPKECKVKTQKITNEPGLIIEYESSAGKPEIVTIQNPASPQIIQQAWTLYSKAFEIAGTNLLAASATKPAGIESGRALEQLGEEHSVRFKHISQHFENVIAVDCSRQFLRAAQCLDKRIKESGDEKGFVLKSKSGKQMIRLKWQDVSVSPDDFFVDVFPVGLLPHLPAGRMEAVQQYMDMGLIDSTMAAELLEFPDLDSVSNPVRADFQLLERQIELMLDEGKEVLPDTRQNLNRALQYGTFCLLSAVHDEAPEDRLDLLRTFLSACEEEISKAAPPPAAPMDAAAPPEAGLPPEAMMGGAPQIPALA